MALKALLSIRPIGEQDRPWVGVLLTEHWGCARIVTRGRMHDATELPGFVASLGAQAVGLVTYRIEAGQCEVVSLNSVHERAGVGTALLEAVAAVAREADLARLWLITTNDNLPALRFYQRRGWRLRAVYPNALEQSRRLKPEIGLVGLEGIPLRDELELELPLPGR